MYKGADAITRNFSKKNEWCEFDENAAKKSLILIFITVISLMFLIVAIFIISALGYKGINFN